MELVKYFLSGLGTLAAFVAYFWFWSRALPGARQKLRREDYLTPSAWYRATQSRDDARFLGTLFGLGAPFLVLLVTAVGSLWWR